MATKLLVCLALVGTAVAVPLSSRWGSDVTSSDSRDCALQCSDNNDKFRYKTGKTYIYDYEVNTHTSMAGASEDSAKMKIQTLAQIEVMTPCEFSLRLKSTQVSLSDPYMGELKPDRESHYQEMYQRNPLRFSFDDGVIRSVCPEPDEDVRVLNFKRGLLSAFQNSMKDLVKNQRVPEVDVTGQCEDVEHNVTSSRGWRGSTTVVTKSKNLLSCSKRHGFKSVLKMVPYSVPSEIQSMPIVKSTHTCKQEINSEGILQTSSCEESHVFAPFSNHQSGGRTDVKQKLSYQSTRHSIDSLQGMVQSRQSLLFQHMNGGEEMMRGQESAEQKLKEICEQTAYDIRPETPRLFAELVEIVGSLDVSNLKNVYLKLKKKSICPQSEKAMKFFMDTLPISGTAGTVEMMLNIMQQGKVNEVEKQAWLLSLSFINNPSDEILPLVLELMKDPMDEQAMLPVSALINNYCQMNANCADNYYISQFIDLLDEKIDFYCATNDKNKQKTLMTLRAIGNVGSSRKFVHTLDRCIRTKYASLDVKVSAINGFRRIPCPSLSDDAEGSLKTILEDKSQDPELRIASYQSLMRCPTDDVLEKMVEVLNSEEDEAVGEYIYSHLNNLLKSSDPHMQGVSQALRRFVLTKKFEANMIKSSRNYQSSMLIKKLNLGYTADADLIWSKSSVIPRAFKANLTMDLFGNSINLFDFGGRMEGVEYLVKLMMGDSKYLPETEKPWTADDLRLILYGRMFGNELAFKYIQGEDLPDGNKKQSIPQIFLKWSKNFNYDFSHSMQLFHGSIIVPTVIGLPVNITVNGTASVNVGLNGKVRTNKLMTRHRSFSFEVDTAGSAGLEVTGTMMVDAHFRKVGLRMRNTLHSSVLLKGRSSYSEDEGFSFVFDAPEDKMELLDARSEFFIVYDGFEKEQKMIENNRREFKKCSGSTLIKMTGYEMCGQMSFANATMVSDAPYYPLTGPSHVSLLLHKRDTHSGYKFFAKWDKKKKHTIGQFLLNTPGSQVNRLISTDITLGYQKDKHIDVTLVSPWTKLNMNGKLISNKNLKHMVGNVRIDDEEYGLTTKVETISSKKEVKHLPLVEIIHRGQVKTILSGEMKMAQGKKTYMSLDLNGLNKHIGSIKGSMVNSGKEKGISLEVIPEGSGSYVIDASSDYKNNKRGIEFYPSILLKTPERTMISITGSGEHRYNRLTTGKANIKIHPFKPITMSANFHKSRDVKKNKAGMSGKVKVKSSFVNADVETSMSSSKKLKKGHMKIEYDIKKLGRDIVSWHGKFSDRSRAPFKAYRMNSNIIFRKNSNYNMKTSIDVSHKKITKVSTKINYGNNVKDKKKQVTVVVQVPSRIPDLERANVNGMITAKFPAKKLDMSLKLNHKHDKSKVDSEMTVSFLPFLAKRTITAQSKLDPKNFSLSGTYYKKSDKLYSFDVKSKMKNWRAASWTALAQTEKKNYYIKTNYRLDKEKVTGVTVLSWGAPQKKLRAIELTLSGSNKQIKAKNTRLMKGSLEFKSPFKNYENLIMRLNANHEPKQLKTGGKFYWGKQDQIKVDMITSLPISPSEVDMSVSFKSPFKGYRQMEMDIKHKLNSKLVTSLRGKVNGAETKLKVEGEHDVNENNRNFGGEISLKTPYKDYKQIDVKLSHSDDYKDYTTIGSLSHNKKKYMANLIMTHDFDGNDIVGRGKLILSSPQKSVETSWNHQTENGMRKLTSKIKSVADKKKLFKIETKGTFESMNSAELDFDMTTKWKALKKVVFELNHHQNDDTVTSKTIFTRNKAKTGYDLQLTAKPETFNTDLKLFLNPLYRRDISFRTNMQYDLFPMTVSTQLEWAPRSKITYEGSLTAPSFEEFDLNSKLTTPFEDYRNINVKSSVRKESSELIAHLNIDYAIRKMIDIETRYRNDEEMKLVSAKITSPFSIVESLETSIRLNTDRKMKLKADFDLQSLEKYESHVYFKKENDRMRGGVQVVTPIEGYSSIEANGEFDTKRDSKRTLHLDFKRSANDVYSLDSSYKLKPFEFNANIRTPNPEFDDVGLVLNHDMLSDGKIVSKGSITYLPKKTVEATLKLQYTTKIDGSLIVKTPFEKFEENKLIIFHNGKLNDFSCHGSVHVAEKEVSGDVNFKNSKSKTNGGFSFTSSLDGIEKVTGNFMVKGKIDNIKGDASLQYGEKVFSTEFSNKIKKNGLKSDFLLNTPMSESLQISVDHEDKSTSNKRIIISSQFWKYGTEQTRIDTEIDHKDVDNTKASLSIDSTSMADTKVKFERNEVDVDFSIDIDTKTETGDKIGLEFSSKGHMDNLKSLFNLTWHDRSIIELTMDTKTLSDKSMKGKVTIGGIMFPEVTSEIDMKGDKSYFTAKAKRSDDVKISHEIMYKQTEEMTEWKADLAYTMYERDHSNMLYFKRDRTEDPGFNFKFHHTPKDSGDLYGFEIEHKGTFEKFKTSSKVHCGDGKAMIDTVDFSKNGLEYIEINAEHRFPFSNYEYHSAKLIFDSQDTRINGIVNLETGHKRKTNPKKEGIALNLLLENMPRKALTFSAESTHDNKMHVLISSELGDGKLACNIKFEDEMKLSFDGVISNSEYPYHPHIHVVTPFKYLKDLTLNYKGEPLDFTTDLTLLMNENDAIEGKTIFKYENPYSMTSMLSLDSTFENVNEWALELKNSEEKRSKKSAVAVSWGPEKKVSFSGDWSKDIYGMATFDRQLTLDIKLPHEKVQTASLLLGVQSDTSMKVAGGQIGFNLNSDKLLDVNMNYNVDDKSASLFVSKPKMMEYSMSQKMDGDFTESQIFINWNRDEPESNMRIKSKSRDMSDSYKTDEESSLTLVLPSRSIGGKYSLLHTATKVLSDAELFWNTDSDSRIFYNIELDDKSVRTSPFIEGGLTIGVPMRTMKLDGNLRVNRGQTISDVNFSWDLDNDKSKKMSLNTKISGNEQTNADFTLKLPAQVQVDSKLVLNKGNTIFDGTTDISYTWDNRKTLTLFSKLENNQGSYGFSSADKYNYSIQFGIRHPDTKVEMAMDSHLGQSPERMTGSVGVQYLTSHRQKKNLALWLEIDKIKKEINLLSATPYKNFGVVGSVLSEEPLKLQAITTSDDQEIFTANIDVDQTLKTIHLEFGNSDNKMHMRALYPNDSAVQLKINHDHDYDDTHQEIDLTMNLASPRLMLANLKWRPEAMKEAQEMLIKTIIQGSEDMKLALSEVSIDFEKEVIRKYKGVTAALSDDSKPILDFIKEEMTVLDQQVTNYQERWSRSVANNDLYLGSLNEVLNKAINAIQEMSDASIQNLNSLAEKLSKLKKYPIGRKYRDMVSNILTKTNDKVDEMVQSLTESIMGMNQQIQELKEESKAMIAKSAEDFKNHPKVQALMSKLQHLYKMDVSPYIEEMTSILRENIDLVTNSEAAQIIESLLNDIESVISRDVLNEGALEVIKMGSNEAYQQAEWIYDNMELEKGSELLQAFLANLREIVKEKAKERFAHVSQFIQNPIRVYDPENGVIEAALILPVDIDKLDEMSKVMEYIQESTKNIQELRQYLTWENSSEIGNTLLNYGEDGTINIRPSRKQ